MTIRELRAKLTDTINSSGMPIDIIDLILENLYKEVHRSMEMAYAQNLVSEAADADHIEKGVNEDGSD